MKQYPFLNSRISQYCFGLFLTALLFLCRDTLFARLTVGFNLAQFLSLGLIGLMAICFLIANREEAREIVFNPRVVFALASSAILLLPMVIKRDWQLMYFSMLLCVFLAVFITYFQSYRETAKYYVLILCVLSVISVFCTYLLRIPADMGLIAPPVEHAEYDVTYYNFGLSYVSIWDVKYRNFGIFREPGVYQYFLMLAIFLTNYAVSWKKPSYQVIANAILMVTMLSTFATGGVIALGLLCIVMFNDLKWYRDKRICVATAAAMVLGVCGLIFVILQHGAIYETLVDMFGKLFTGGDSVTDRVGSIVRNTELFLSSPLWGRGISETLHIIDNNTSSSTILFAVLGFFGGALNVMGWFALVWDKNRKVIFNLALVVILAMTFNTENLIADPFLWLFPVMAMVERLLPWILEKMPARKELANG